MHHYRSALTYSNDRMLEAAAIEQRILWLLSRAAAAVETAQKRKWSVREHALAELVQDAYITADSALRNDFDTPQVMQTILDIATKTHSYLDTVEREDGAVGEVLSSVTRFVTGQLRVFGVDLEPQAESKETEGAVDVLLDFRAAVRQQAISLLKTDGKGVGQELLALCDELRDEVLPSIGITVGDGAQGKPVRRQ